MMTEEDMMSLIWMVRECSLCLKILSRIVILLEGYEQFAVWIYM
jgi:hypothetical protein